jgi:hypothetical protein
MKGMRELPSGTVTFLFTHVEGSTPLWERKPAAMRALDIQRPPVYPCDLSRQPMGRRASTEQAAWRLSH